MDENKYHITDPYQLLLLNKSLASEEQMNEKGRPIIGKGHKSELSIAEELSEMYGGEPDDWTKVTSNSYLALDNVRFETHWYENKKLGLKVEYKTKFT